MVSLALPALVAEFGIHQSTLANARLALIGMAHNASAVPKVNIGTETPAFPAQVAKYGVVPRFLASVNKAINGTAPTASFLALTDKYWSMESANVPLELT